MLSNKWNRIVKYISESELVEDVEEIQKEIEEISELTKNRIIEILSRNKSLVEIKKEMVSNSLSDSFFPYNDISNFLDREIFTDERSEYKANELYLQYKFYCDDYERTQPIGKNKFYSILKLGKRIKFQHRIDGDYFIFELDNEKTA